MPNTAEFHRPPLDGTLTIDEIYDWHRKNSPDVPAFIFPEESQSLKDQTHNLTWQELGDGIERGINIIENLIPETRSGAASLESQDPLVIGIFATSDIITYTTFLFSHIRLSHPTAPGGNALLPFPISARNSPAAVSHLANITRMKYMWITEGPMKTIVDEALKEGGLGDVFILKMPSFFQLYHPLDSSIQRRESGVAKPSLGVPALILHSSGSTAFPKPRTISHAILLEWSKTFEQSGMDGMGKIMSVHGSPVFHAVGVCIALCAATTGYIRATPSPHVAVPVVTPEYFLQEITRSNSALLVTVPSFLEAWSCDSANVEKLKKLKAIFWGGAPLNSEIGRLLHREGVSIHNFFGATEFGIVSVMTDRPYPEDYEWFRFAKHVLPVFIPEAEGGVFELAIKQTESHHLGVLNTEIDGMLAYASNDLIERHPDDPNLYRVIGRKDDQIMLSTGEKTNPGPLESIIVENAHVKGAVMFGRGRTQNGVLIEPESYEEVEKLGLEGFRNLIWPSIDQANRYAPAHSRVFKEMIVLASSDKPFTYTVKLNARRGAIIISYKQEIDSVYKAVEDSAQLDVPIPVGTSETGGWKLEEALQYVANVVNKVMVGGNAIAIDDDLFGRGCDSLQATYIRNAILHGLRQAASSSVIHNIPSNFVYQQPTINGLARYVVALLRPGTNPALGKAHLERARLESLEKMVENYTQNWHVHCPSTDFSNIVGEYVLLTGSTGGLGSQLLAQLVEMPSISRVYAFNRPGRDGTSSRERHAEALLDRGNDVNLLDSKKIKFIEGDTSVDGFGIDPRLYNEIRDSVTTIIHTAWRVDFNLSLLSFEPAIRGVRFLIDLSLRSPHPAPPRVIFTSSVGIVKTWVDIPPVQESPINEPSIINTSGYAESKWVSERILEVAGQKTALNPLIIRVHQLSGGINGSWNVREWFPALVHAGQVVGAVPDNDGLVSFLPLHVAASALIELRHSTRHYVHLAHPRPVSWRSIIKHISEALQIPIIPYEQWLACVESFLSTDSSPHDDPALHLLDFYKAAVQPEDVRNIDRREAMGIAMYDTEETVAEAPSLQHEHLSRLDKDDVESWIGYWRQKRDSTFKAKT